MTCLTIITRLFRVFSVAACAAISSGAILGLKCGLHALWPQAGFQIGIVCGLAAPLGVVLFALLVEQTTREQGTAKPYGLSSVRYFPSVPK